VVGGHRRDDDTDFPRHRHWFVTSGANPQMNEQSWCPTVQVGACQLCCFSSGGLFTACCRRHAVVTVSAKTSSPVALLHNFWPATVPWGLTPTALRVRTRVTSRSSVHPFDWGQPSTRDAALSGARAPHVCYSPGLVFPGVSERIAQWADRARSLGHRTATPINNRATKLPLVFLSLTNSVNMIGSFYVTISGTAVRP